MRKTRTGPGDNFSLPSGFLSMLFVLLLSAASAWGQDIRAGYAKVDITPEGPVMLGGYDLRGAPSNGIWGNDRLYARPLVFEAAGVRVAFVEADVIEI